MFSDGAQIACVMKLSITNPRKSSFYSVNLMFSFVHLSVEELTHLMSRYLDCARHATLFFFCRKLLWEKILNLYLWSHWMLRPFHAILSFFVAYSAFLPYLERHLGHDLQLRTLKMHQTLISVQKSIFFGLLRKKIIQSIIVRSLEPWLKQLYWVIRLVLKYNRMRIGEIICW